MRKPAHLLSWQTISLTFVLAIVVMTALLASNLWFAMDNTSRREHRILHIMQAWPLNDQEPNDALPLAVVEAETNLEDLEDEDYTPSLEATMPGSATVSQAVPLSFFSTNSSSEKETSGVKSCAEKSMGFSKFETYMKDAVVLCANGLSKIICPSFYPREDGLKRAFFCYLENVFEVLDPLTQRLHWLVHCKLDKTIKQSRFFQDLAKNDYLHHLQVSTTLPYKLRGGIAVIEQEGFTREQLLQDIQSKYKLARRLGPLDSTLTYAVNGDCNTGNPGHCQADPHLLYIVRKMLGFSQLDTRLILLSGFGRSNYLSTSTVQRLPQFFSDLQALAASIFIDIKHDPVYPELLVKGPSYVRPLGVLSTSPFSSYGPHWQGFRENRSCEAASPMLLEVQGKLLQYRRQDWDSAPEDLGYNDICEFMRRLERSGEPTRIFGLDESCAPPFKVLYWVSRHGNGRHILNEVDIVERLYKDPAMNFTHFIVANPGLYDPKDQTFLASIAHTIIGPHGGGMWEAARWSLRVEPRIRIVEILPMLGPGDSCVLATMMGAKYKAIECRRCIPQVKHTAELEHDLVRESLLEGFPPFSCKSLKEPKPERKQETTTGADSLRDGLLASRKEALARKVSNMARSRLRGNKISMGIG